MCGLEILVEEGSFVPTVTSSLLLTSSLLEFSGAWLSRPWPLTPPCTQRPQSHGGSGAVVEWEPADMGQACLTVQAMGAHFSEVPLHLPAMVWPILELRHLETAPSPAPARQCCLCSPRAEARAGGGGGCLWQRGRVSEGRGSGRGVGCRYSRAVSHAP